jgi:hypothetical protein
MLEEYASKRLRGFRSSAMPVVLGRWRRRLNSNVPLGSVLEELTRGECRGRPTRLVGDGRKRGDFREVFPRAGTKLDQIPHSLT